MTPLAGVEPAHEQNNHGVSVPHERRPRLIVLVLSSLLLPSGRSLHPPGLSSSGAYPRGRFGLSLTVLEVRPIEADQLANCFPAEPRDLGISVVASASRLSAAGVVLMGCPGGREPRVVRELRSFVSRAFYPIIVQMACPPVNARPIIYHAVSDCVVWTCGMLQFAMVVGRVASRAFWHCTRCIMTLQALHIGRMSISLVWAMTCGHMVWHDLAGRLHDLAGGPDSEMSESTPPNQTTGVQDASPLS